MKKLTLLMALFLAGCTASQEKLNTVAVEEADRLARSSKPLSAFANFELKAMTLSSEVRAKPDKVEEAAVLETKINEKLQPLFAQWSRSNKAGRSGTLVVQLELVKLRIVSGGARFFAGAFSGDSFIDLDIRLIDGSTNSEIARPRVMKNAGAMGGAWSIGKTDQNLHDYVAHIVHRYMVVNYRGYPDKPVASANPGDSVGTSDVPASAAPHSYTVDAKATGGFGRHPDVKVPRVLNMVPGFVFSGPGALRITTGGTIDLAQNFAPFQNVTPDGLKPKNRVATLGAADRHTPLEEALADAGGDLPSNFSNAGSLMGAFVPQAIANKPDFLAKDDDYPNGGISSDSLFFIGSGPFHFTTDIPGTLFLGINDPRANNNSGSYEVAVAVIDSGASSAGAGSVPKSDIAIGVDGNVARAAPEPRPMMTRDKVTAYIENSKRQFETDLTYYLRRASSISRGGRIYRVYSYEILEADRTRVVLKLHFTYNYYGQRAEDKEFVLAWRGDKLAFMSHQGL